MGAPEGRCVRLGPFVDPRRRCSQLRRRHRKTARLHLSCPLKTNTCRPSPFLHQTNPSPFGTLISYTCKAKAKGQRLRYHQTRHRPEQCALPWSQHLHLFVNRVIEV